MVIADPIQRTMIVSLETSRLKETYTNRFVEFYSPIDLYSEQIGENN